MVVRIALASSLARRSGALALSATFNKWDEVFCSGFKIMSCTAGMSILSPPSEHLFCCFPSHRLQAAALQENLKTSDSPGMGRLKRVGIYSEIKP